MKRKVIGCMMFVIVASSFTTFSNTGIYEIKADNQLSNAKFSCNFDVLTGENKVCQFVVSNLNSNEKIKNVFFIATTLDKNLPDSGFVEKYGEEAAVANGSRFKINGKKIINGSVKGVFDSSKLISGKYKVRLYVRTTSGKIMSDMNMDRLFSIDNEKSEIVQNKNNSAIIVERSNNGIGLDVTVNNKTSQGQYNIAVWSEVKGQDDLRWTSFSGKENKFHIDLSKNKGWGIYNIHVYKKVNGIDKLVGTTKFDLKKPTLNISANELADGSVEIKAFGIESAAGVKKVVLRVSSGSSSKPYKQFTMKKVGDNTYSYVVDAEDLLYTNGQHRAYILIRDYNNISGGVAQAFFEVKGIKNAENLSVESNDNEKTFDLKAINKKYSSDRYKMNVAVWSEVNGQDDLQWITLSKNKGSYFGNFEVSKHGDPGKYYAHFYVQDKETNNNIFVGSKEFNVHSDVQGEFDSIIVNQQYGQIKTRISAKGKRPIDSVRLRVWKDGKDDLKEYTCKNTGNGWTANIMAKNHKDHFGKYTIQALAVMDNGVFGIIDTKTVDLFGKNYIRKDKMGDGTYKITISNLDNSYNKIYFPTWSNENGQDDINWYEGVKNQNGSYTIKIDGSKHKHPGKYTTHIYGNKNGQNVILGQITYYIPKSALVSEATARINRNIEQVYNKVGRDLYNCFNYVSKSITYKRIYGHVTPPHGYTREQWYAIMGLEQKRGNCFSYAASFAFLARGLGYDAEYVEGQVDLARGGYGPHGWVEIRTNNGRFICDPEEQKMLGQYNFYMQPVGSTVLNYVR